MAPSGPCGSDRLDTSLTSSESALAYIAMQYRSQSGVKPPCKLARRLLLKCAKHRQWAVCGGSLWQKRVRRVRGGRSGVGEKRYGESDIYHQQQELFLLVAARLAADQVLRAGIRRNHYLAR